MSTVVPYPSTLNVSSRCTYHPKFPDFPIKACRRRMACDGIYSYCHNIYVFIIYIYILYYDTGPNFFLLSLTVLTHSFQFFGERISRQHQRSQMDRELLLATPYTLALSLMAGANLQRPTEQMMPRNVSQRQIRYKQAPTVVDLRGSSAGDYRAARGRPEPLTSGSDLDADDIATNFR
jgi:hypothetical protein